MEMRLRLFLLDSRRTNTVHSYSAKHRFKCTLVRSYNNCIKYLGMNVKFWRVAMGVKFGPYLSLFIKLEWRSHTVPKWDRDGKQGKQRSCSHRLDSHRVGYKAGSQCCHYNAKRKKNEFDDVDVLSFILWHVSLSPMFWTKGNIYMDTRILTTFSFNWESRKASAMFQKLYTCSCKA